VSTLLLVDGNNLAYRAFFALPTDLATSSGQITNAVYGFTSMLIYVLNEHRPDGLAVVFDRPERTFRHDLVEGYKAGRAETPDILRQQMGLVHRVVDALRVPSVEVPGYEADDVLATLAGKARDEGLDVIVLSGDRDTYQLVEDPHVKVLYPKRGVSEYVLYDEAGVKERTGVAPKQYPEYAALRGDPSDNLPGVPGVAEKTAAKLINTYGGLDGVFSHLEECTPKLRENLGAAEQQVRRNVAAIALVRDLDLDVEVASLRMGDWDLDEVRQLFNFLEFRTLWDRLLEATSRSGAPAVPAGAGAERLEVEIERVRDAAGLAALADELLAAGGPVAVEGRFEPGAGGAALAGLGLARGIGQAWWVGSEVLGSRGAARTLTRLFGAGGVPVHAHNAKALMRGLEPLGVDLRSLDVDTAVAAYLVDPAESQYVLEELCLRYLGTELRPPDAAPAGQLDLSGTVTDPAEEVGRRTAAVFGLAAALDEALSARALRKLYDDIERPLVRVLARMESVGVRVDQAELRRLAGELATEVRQLETRIQDLAGEEFKVNSTPQLRHILFDKLGLAPQKKTKTGYSTDAASLEKLLGQHPIIEALLRYREVEKLRSTYGESLLAEVAPDGRIHATFNQTVARTGRLSSDAPNLHNIPVRSEDGRRFRKAFIPADGCRFLIADYNQIELRVIAHLAQDPGLIESFSSGADIHRSTASAIFGVPPAKVTLAQRSKAKMVSYGLAYGMEAYGLAQRLNIERAEAAEILKSYFTAFPNVKAYMDAAVAEAHQKGYTETLFGRRRPIPELASGVPSVRQAGERQAMNAGIQGLAADIFKAALVRLDGALEEGRLRSRLVLQVHDEVILEVPPEEEDAVAAATRAATEGAAELSVPLVVNLVWGATWADAKG